MTQIIESLMVELTDLGREVAIGIKAWGKIPDEITERKNIILTKLLPLTNKTRKELLREARKRRNI